MNCSELTEVPKGDWHCAKCASARAGEQARHGKGMGIWESYTKKINMLLGKIRRR